MFKCILVCNLLIQILAFFLLALYKNNSLWERGRKIRSSTLDWFSNLFSSIWGYIQSIFSLWRVDKARPIILQVAYFLRLAILLLLKLLVRLIWWFLYFWRDAYYGIFDVFYYLNKFYSFFISRLRKCIFLVWEQGRRVRIFFLTYHSKLCKVLSKYPVLYRIYNLIILMASGCYLAFVIEPLDVIIHVVRTKAFFVIFDFTLWFLDMLYYSFITEPFLWAGQQRVKLGSFLIWAKARGIYYFNLWQIKYEKHKRLKYWGLCDVFDKITSYLSKNPHTTRYLSIFGFSILIYCLVDWFFGKLVDSVIRQLFLGLASYTNSVCSFPGKWRLKTVHGTRLNFSMFWVLRRIQEPIFFTTTGHYIMEVFLFLSIFFLSVRSKIVRIIYLFLFTLVWLFFIFFFYFCFCYLKYDLSLDILMMSLRETHWPNSLQPVMDNQAYILSFPEGVIEEFPLYSIALGKLLFYFCRFLFQLILIRLVAVPGGLLDLFFLMLSSLFNFIASNFSAYYSPFYKKVLVWFFAFGAWLRSISGPKLSLIYNWWLGLLENIKDKSSDDIRAGKLRIISPGGILLLIILFLAGIAFVVYPVTRWWAILCWILFILWVWRPGDRY